MQRDHNCYSYHNFYANFLFSHKSCKKKEKEADANLIYCLGEDRRLDNS